MKDISEMRRVHQIIYLRQEESSLPDLGQSSTPSMPDISISFKVVHKLLSELKIHKAAGPDSI